MFVPGNMADKTKLSVVSAMQFLKDCFDRHAKKDGAEATMTKAELADMLRQQFDIVSKIFTIFFFHLRLVNAS